MVKTQEVVQHNATAARRKPVAGDMQWNGEVWRRWSGRRWTRAVYALNPERLKVATPLVHEPEVVEQRRRRALQLAVEHQVTTNSASVVLDGPHGVVLAYRRPVAHFFHAVLTILTAGLWVVVWVGSALSRREDRVRLEVDRWGSVWATPVRGT